MAKQIATLFKKDYYVLFIRDTVGNVLTLVDPLVAPGAIPHWLAAQDDTPFYHFDKDLVRDNSLRLRGMPLEKLTANIPEGFVVTDRTIHIRRVQQTVHDVPYAELDISRLYKTKGHDLQFNEESSAVPASACDRTQSFLLEDENGKLAFIQRRFRMGIPANVIRHAKAVYDLRQRHWLKPPKEYDGKEVTLSRFLEDRKQLLESVPKAISVGDYSFTQPLTVAYEHTESGFYCGVAPKVGVTNA
jgi:hypothetical protein